MKIIIDTNIFFQDFPLVGTGFSTLFKGLKVTEHSLHIPKIVIDEVANKYREEYQKYYSQVEQLGLETVGLIADQSKMAKSEEACEKYRTYFISKIKEVGSEIIDYPNPPHEQLIQRALQRKKPFRSTDTGGYRDVLLWYSILEIVKRNSQTSIAFITHNPRDFADTNSQTKLHPDLIQDLEEISNDPNTIVLYKSLADFVNKHVKSQLEELDQIKVQLSSKSHPKLDLELFLTEQLIDHIGWMEFESEELGFPSDFETSHLSMIEKIDSVNDLDVRKLSHDEVLISFTAEAETEFDVFIEKSNYYSMRESERPFIWESDWNKWYMAGSVSIQVRISVSLIADADSWEIRSANLDSVKPIEEWWKKFY